MMIDRVVYLYKFSVSNMLTNIYSCHVFIHRINFSKKVVRDPVISTPLTRDSSFSIFLDFHSIRFRLCTCLVFKLY